MERSFSIVEDDDDDVNIEEILKSQFKQNNYPEDKSEEELESGSEENSNSPKRSNPALSSFNLAESKKHVPEPLQKHSAKPSFKLKDDKLSSDSDLDDDLNLKKAIQVEGEYDPKEYENLDVDPEIKELFQYIIKYTPQQLNVDYKFKPFIPEFLPAVGDIDAFIKVIAPVKNLDNDTFEPSGNIKLGLTVLDEPSAHQSDPALLHLQLRHASVKVAHGNANIVVKKVEDVEKGSKTIDKWIKDISDLHKTKSSPIVRYAETMPDLDDLMQEWPEDVEAFFNENGFPSPDNQSLSEYVEIVCNTFGIPTEKNKIHSLHLLFSLFAAVKASQLYQASNQSNKEEASEKNDQADQLVLD